MNIQQIGKAVDRMIREEELPTTASLRVMRQFDSVRQPMGIEDEDDTDMIEDPEELEIERGAWCDFIRQHIEKDHRLISIIPQDSYEQDFFRIELDEMGHDVSAFNTADYQRTHAPFSLYHWQLEKLCEKVKHMAIDFSIIKDEKAKISIRTRALQFINTKGHLHKDILCKIWLDYAYWK